MKKITNVIICVLCVLLLVACGNKSLPNNMTADTLADTVINAVGGQPETNTTYAQKVQTLDAYTMSLWADGAYEECDEFELLDEYYIFCSADNSTYEVSVLKAESEADISKLTAVLERRKQTLSQGDKAEYDPNFKKLMADSKIITEGRFAILLITPDNTAAIKAIDNLKQ